MKIRKYLYIIILLSFMFFTIKLIYRYEVCKKLYNKHYIAALKCEKLVSYYNSGGNGLETLLDKKSAELELKFHKKMCAEFERAALSPWDQLPSDKQFEDPYLIK